MHVHFPPRLTESSTLFTTVLRRISFFFSFLFLFTSLLLYGFYHTSHGSSFNLVSVILRPSANAPPQSFHHRHGHWQRPSIPRHGKSKLTPKVPIAKMESQETPMENHRRDWERDEIVPGRRLVPPPRVLIRRPWHVPPTLLGIKHVVGFFCLP